MKATKPPRETVSSLNYRDADDTPTATAADIKRLSSAALIYLARKGEAQASTGSDGERLWRASTVGRGGFRYAITCTGPDLSSSVPDETAHPSIIPHQRPWIGTYRLSVAAPLVVLDISWRADEPLRIMGFSRGDWEAEILALNG